MWQNSQQHQHEHRTRRDRTRPDCEAPLHGESTTRRPAADRARIDIGSYHADDAAFRAATGWQPLVDLEQGIGRSLDWFLPRLADYL